MGFIKLTLQTPASLANREQQQHKATELARLAAEAEAKRQEEERLKAEEARKPKLFEGKIKKGSVVDAEVVAVNGSKVTLRLYVAGHDTDRPTITYNGLTVGRILVVTKDDLQNK